jgi:hypothetical protein
MAFGRCPWGHQGHVGRLADVRRLAAFGVMAYASRVIYSASTRQYLPPPPSRLM